MTHPHENWQDDPQREPRKRSRREFLLPVDALDAEPDEDFLDERRGVWRPTE
jgi:hypothetical protein